MKFSYTIVFFLLAAFGALHAQAGVKPPFEMPKQYAVDIATTNASMPQANSTGKFVVDGEKLRADMSTGAGKAIVLVRGDLKKIYMLMVANKTYMELPYMDQANPAKSLFPDGEWTDLGSEAVKGVTAKKYKLVAKVQGVETTSTYWINPATSYPVRVEQGDSVVEFSNFKAGPQAASTFELPEGYTAQTMPQMPSMPN
ncbi:hypothetical protein DB346_23720 [Verrucomicrobia bacterium LW23]|nr:hypothetical protein DB346_23720 [Verrucomicrobia bacterium LW23]